MRETVLRVAAIAAVAGAVSLSACKKLATTAVVKDDTSAGAAGGRPTDDDFDNLVEATMISDVLLNELDPGDPAYDQAWARLQALAANAAPMDPSTEYPPYVETPEGGGASGSPSGSDASGSGGSSASGSGFAAGSSGSSGSEGAPPASTVPSTDPDAEASLRLADTPAPAGAPPPNRDPHAGDEVHVKLALAHFNRGEAEAGADVLRRRFNECYRFDGCSNRIASLAKVAPRFTNEFKQNSPYEALRNAIETKAGIREPLLKRLALLRLDVAVATQHLHEATQLLQPSSAGRVPFIKQEFGQRAEVQALIDRIINKTDGLAKDGAAATTRAIQAALAKNYGGNNEMPADVVAGVARDQWAALSESYVGLLCLKEYYERLFWHLKGQIGFNNNYSPEAWLRDIEARVEGGQLKPATAFNTLAMFAQFEVQAAYGDIWVQSMIRIQVKYFPKERDPVKQSLIDGLNDQLTTRKAQYNAFIEQAQINWGNTLARNEKMVAENYAGFNGTYYEMRQALRSQAALSDFIKSIPDVENIAPEKLERLTAYLQKSSEDELAISCWGFFSENNFTRKDSPLYEKAAPYVLTVRFLKKQLHPYDVCMSDPGADWSWVSDQTITVRENNNASEWLRGLRRGDSNPRQNIIGLLSRAQIEQQVAPVRLEIGLQLAALPLTILSGGAAAGTVKVATTGLSIAAKRLATAAATQVVRSAVVRGVTLFAQKTVAFVAEVTLFSVYNRLLTNGLLTAYGNIAGDELALKLRKSMFDNYYHEILTGIPIFAILPRVSSLATRGAFRLVGKPVVAGAPLPALVGRQLLAKDLAVTVLDVAGQNAVFLTSDLVQKQVEHLMKRKEGDPIFRSFSASDFYKASGQASYFALGFRAYHNLSGHVVAESSAEAVAREQIEAVRASELTAAAGQ